MLTSQEQVELDALYRDAFQRMPRPMLEEKSELLQCIADHPKDWALLRELFGARDTQIEMMLNIILPIADEVLDYG